MRYERDSRKLIKMLRDDEWDLVRITGSHHHFRKEGRPGLVTVPHPKRDIRLKTVISIYMQAGWKQ